jgi:hypothetical protein
MGIVLSHATEQQNVQEFEVNFDPERIFLVFSLKTSKSTGRGPSQPL